MSQIYACILGGSPRPLQASTVGEARSQLGVPGDYTATLNGETANDRDSIPANGFVSFSQAVKGGC